MHKKSTERAQREHRETSRGISRVDGVKYLYVCRVSRVVLTPFLARVLGLLRPNRPQPSRVLLPLLDARAQTVGLFQFPAAPRPGLVPAKVEGLRGCVSISVYEYMSI